MRGLWAEPGVPHKGWTCDGIEDIGDPSGLCEMCLNEFVRYIHVMNHEDYRTVNAGCVCAGRMAEDYNATRAERNFKQRAIRRGRWMYRPWKFSAGGNQYTNVRGHNIVIFRKGFKWRWRIKSENGKLLWADHDYETEIEAKAGAFVAFELGGHAP